MLIIMDFYLILKKNGKKQYRAWNILIIVLEDQICYF